MESLDEKEQSKRTIPSAPRPRRRPPPKAATWDQSKAVILAKKGVSHKDIASVVGCRAILFKHTCTVFAQKWPRSRRFGSISATRWR